MTSKRPTDFVDFLNASPTPFHVVRSARSRLEKAGFKQLRERDSWQKLIQPGGRYYVIRNASSIIAFTIGGAWKPGNPIAMVGTHVDSPCLRLKPISRRSADGFLQVAVETYGGGMWHSWFDRDLGAAGRIMVRTKDNSIEQKLVRITKPICRIPSLAVHFGESVPFEFNKETNLFPIAGLASAELSRLGKTAGSAQEEQSAESTDGTHVLKTIKERHHPQIVDLLAESAGVAGEDIIDMEVVLYDTQPACIGGLNDELIFSARLDNLGMTYCAIEGLLKSMEDPAALSKDHIARMITCFDNEEIGSQTAQGADGDLLPSIIRRISSVGDSEDTRTAFEQTCAKSVCVSADMAHSVNPNYSGKYETEHKPQMNAGTVVKINANQRYATNAPGIAFIEEFARRAKPTSWQNQRKQNERPTSGVSLQLFVVRNDGRCGTTIGRLTSSQLGIRTIDVGNAQLSMHSIRETCGAHDLENAINLFESFFEHYGELADKIVDDGPVGML